MQSNHILLVDDDVLLRCSVAFSLERAGYRVTTAASAGWSLRQAVMRRLQGVEASRSPTEHARWLGLRGRTA